MLKIILFSLCLLSLGIKASDHDHEKDHEHKEDHSEEEAHDEHGSAGFKLSAIAVKNFGLTYIDYKNSGTTIPTKTIFRSLSEVNLYRLRAGLYKRIDFKTLEKKKDGWIVISSDLASGDKIVIDGIGFLRIAEIAASGGLSDSHSH